MLHTTENKINLNKFYYNNEKRKCESIENFGNLIKLSIYIESIKLLKVR